MVITNKLLLVLLLLSCSMLDVGAWKAGSAAIRITPENLIWLAGYAARDKPAQGTTQDLYAKALAIEDQNGKRAVLVTMDLLGFSASFTSAIAGLVQAETGLTRERLLFNASHTHSGPALTQVLDIAYDMSPQQKADVDRYTEKLKQKIVDVILESLQKLEPARISYGKAEAFFGINRRVKTSEGFVIGANRSGPVDHDVPILAVDRENGQMIAVVFGYSCHNTTLQGTNYFYHGDYAGVAQERLERRYPGAHALFVTGTAGDANPYPRGTRELAEEHGLELAHSISKALTGPMQPVEGTLKSILNSVQVRFTVPTRTEFEAKLEEPNKYVRAHAQSFLKILDDEGVIKNTYTFPIQIWRLGEVVNLVALPGEVVVDYGIRIRSLLHPEETWVVGYSNDVFAYIPSRRILREGGYEACDSMIYYGQPGPFEPSVQEIVERGLQEAFRSIESEE